MKFLSHLTKSLLILISFSSPISGAAIDNPAKKDTDNYETGKTYEITGELFYITLPMFSTGPLFGTKDDYVYINNLTQFSIIHHDFKGKLMVRMVRRNAMDNKPITDIMEVIESEKKSETGAVSTSSAK